VTDITLVVISPLKGFVQPNGKIILTEKFVEGMKLYRELWGGPILHLCEPATGLSDNLDNIEVETKTAEFDTLCAPMSDGHLRSVLPPRSIVLVAVGEQFNSVGEVCRKLKIPCIYVTEYSLRTRHQIVSEFQRSALRGVWQKLRQTQQEISQRKAISLASGVQCNGLPTYNSYRKLNQNAHLFFDNRTTVVASDDRVSRRSFEKRMGKKLRLTFSGRLSLMKGVDDLLVVAQHLRKMLDGSFHLSICGDGEFADQLHRDIQANGLTDLVTMRGTMDFKTELVPFVTNETDIFVCCHRQGDPSCTYLETMACGVPIVGYANEAWKQLSYHSNAGWVTKLGDPEVLACKIASLYQTPGTIERQSLKSLDFARDHTFEKTFQKRINHLKGVADSHSFN
jgi:glycosyltransferase involved in cell wall biosynthesis